MLSFERRLSTFTYCLHNIVIYRHWCAGIDRLDTYFYNLLMLNFTTVLELDSSLTRCLWKYTTLKLDICEHNPNLQSWRQWGTKFVKNNNENTDIYLPRTCTISSYMRKVNRQSPKNTTSLLIQPAD